MGGDYKFGPVTLALMYTMSNSNFKHNKLTFMLALVKSITSSAKQQIRNTVKKRRLWDDATSYYYCQTSTEYVWTREEGISLILNPSWSKRV